MMYELKKLWVIQSFFSMAAITCLTFRRRGKCGTFSRQDGGFTSRTGSTYGQRKRYRSTSVTVKRCSVFWPDGPLHMSEYVAPVLAKVSINPRGVPIAEQPPCGSSAPHTPILMIPWPSVRARSEDCTENFVPQPPLTSKEIFFLDGMFDSWASWQESVRRTLRLGVQPVLRAREQKNAEAVKRAFFMVVLRACR